MGVIVAVSVNFHYAALSVREKVHFTPSRKEDCYALIHHENILKEVVIISTCNRSEIYGVVEDAADCGYLRKLFKRFFHLSQAEVDESLELLAGEKAARHLYEVAGGFQSIVLGEDQILGQVKEAHQEALEGKHSGKLLNKVFLSAITFGKKFRSATGISDIPTSVSSIGLKLAKKKLGSFQKKKALVIGLGEMNWLMLKYLACEGLECIYIANRTLRETGLTNEEAVNIKMIPFEDRHLYINEVDLIVSGTSAPHYVLYCREFQEEYENRPLYILDLAVPRDVDPAIGKYQNVHLIVVDDLKEYSDESLRERERCMQQGIGLLKEEMQRFQEWCSRSLLYNKEE